MSTLDLRFTFGLGGFSLTLDQALPLEGLTAIYGPSGAGKSTLLRAIAGFQRTGGHVAFAGEVWEDVRHFIPPNQRRVGFVFQEPRLFAHLDVAGNLAYGLRRSGQGDDLTKMVERFELRPLLTRRVSSLSGGEAQRVALARTLLSDPRLLVMDEPLSALDATRRAEILPQIDRLRDEGRLPILYVSHSLSEVARLATRVLVLAEGRVVAFGATAEVLADSAAGSAYGSDASGSLIEARLEMAEPDGLSRLSFAGGAIFAPAIVAHPGDRLRLFVRARDVMIATVRPEGLSALNIFAARIVAIVAVDAASVDVRLTCGGASLRARITRRSAATLGLQAGGGCYAILKSVALARD